MENGRTVLGDGEKWKYREKKFVNKTIDYDATLEKCITIAEIITHVIELLYYYAQCHHWRSDATSSFSLTASRSSSSLLSDDYFSWCDRTRRRDTNYNNNTANNIYILMLIPRLLNLSSKNRRVINIMNW